MSDFLEKIGVSKKLQRNLGAILIVACCGSIIYGLPYFRYDYYDAYLAAYNLTNTQVGIFGSIYGVFGMISYLFGGVLADRFPTRTLVSISMIATGLGGFLHLLPLPYWALVALYAFWGFSSLFAFWPACIKAVRVMSDSDTQGKAYGIFEGGRGVCSAVVTLLVVFVFRFSVGELSTETLEGQIIGMRAIIIFYSVITVAFGVFAWLTMSKEDYIEKSERVTFKDIGSVIKMPAVWIIAIVTFCNYVYCLSLYYFVPYSTSFLGLTVVMGALIASVKRWLCPLSNVGGGFLGDKIGTGNLLFASFVAMIIGTIGIMVLPEGTSTVIAVIFVILYLGSYMFFNVNYSLTWAMMEEGAVPENVSGTAAGLISTIGYLPDVFISLMAGIMIDNNLDPLTGEPLKSGYIQFFSFLVGALVVGAVFTWIWKIYLKRHNLGKGRGEAAKADAAV